MRSKRSPPLVTLDRTTWASVAALAVGSDLERWGFLCGRRTRTKPACFRVVCATLGPVDEQTEESLKINGDDARRTESILAKEDKVNPPVGSWHSHPMRARTAQALAPQLSETDKISIQDGSFDVIVVTYPRPGDEVLRGNEYVLVREVDGRVVRAEAWLRRGGRFLPCEVRTR